MKLKRVVLVTTGQMELLALADNLKKFFAGVDFISLAGAHKVGRAEPYAGFTSVRVQTNLDKTPRDLRNLVEGMAGAVQQYRDALVVVLDDLELVNQDQAPVVRQAFAQAVQQHIKDLPSRINRDQFAQELRARASFHLAVPMTEAWFFGDPAMLAPLEPFLANPDPEDFLTADAAYAADTGANCTAWGALPLNRQTEHRPAWLKGSDRTRHPKAYLSWLQHDPADKKCTCYQETKAGADYLRQLDWAQVLANSSHFVYARAFLADLAWALDIFPPNINFAAAPVPPPTCLRNL